MTFRPKFQSEVCIIVPTFRRTEGLKNVIESIFNQTIMSRNVRIIVIDNNAVPEESILIERLSKDHHHPIDYFHEPDAGVSNARNAAMKMLNNERYLAFIDDDMVVAPNWLENLIATSKSLNAGLVFGPTHAVMPDSDDPKNMYLEPFFARRFDIAEDCLTEDTLGTGGCLLDLEYCDLPSPPFRPDLNETGGEDDIFFDHLRTTGTKVGYSVNAVSYEIVPRERVCNDYIWKRNFGYGQGPTRIQASRGWSGAIGVLYFMTTGCLQLLAFYPLFVVSKIAKKPSGIKYLALTARALGKVFWIRNFTPLLYGKAMNC